jgi:hypothetical protein
MNNLILIFLIVAVTEIARLRLVLYKMKKTGDFIDSGFAKDAHNLASHYSGRPAYRSHADKNAQVAREFLVKWYGGNFENNTDGQNPNFIG